MMPSPDFDESHVEAIYKIIFQYKGGQIPFPTNDMKTHYEQVCDLLFLGLTKFFNKWMEKTLAEYVNLKPKQGEKSVNQKDLREKLKEEIHFKLSGTSNDLNSQLGKVKERFSRETIEQSDTNEIDKSVLGKAYTQYFSPLQPNKVVEDEYKNSCYKIKNFNSFLGTIYLIGTDSDSNHKIYLIQLMNEDIVFTRPITHYNGTIKHNENYISSDDEKYESAYEKLLENAKKNMGPQEAKQFIAQGEPPSIKNEKKKPLELLASLVATYICESNRNWVHLLLSLLQLGLRDLTTYEGYSKETFIMKGGSWKQQYTWGSNKNPKYNGNPNDEEQAKKAALEIKTRFIAEIIKLLNNEEHYHKDDATQSKYTNKEDWTAYIKYSLMHSLEKSDISKKNVSEFVSGKIANKWGKALKEAVKTCNYVG